LLITPNKRYETILKQEKRCGGLLSFDRKVGVSVCSLKRTKLIVDYCGLGELKPCYSSCNDAHVMNETKKSHGGITKGFDSCIVGLEDIDVLIAAVDLCLSELFKCA